MSVGTAFHLSLSLFPERFLSFACACAVVKANLKERGIASASREERCTTRGCREHDIEISISSITCLSAWIALPAASDRPDGRRRQ